MHDFVVILLATGFASRVVGIENVTIVSAVGCYDSVRIHTVIRRIYVEFVVLIEETRVFKIVQILE